MNRRLVILLAIAGALGLAFFVDRLVLRADLSQPQQGRTNPELTTEKALPPRFVGQENLLPEFGNFEEIWKRPLFNQDRKADVTEGSLHLTTFNAQQGSSAASTAPKFTIVGIAIRPDGGSAIIQNPSREFVRVMVGDQIDGWLVETLTPQYVTFSKNKERWQLPVGTE
ncbi:MAG: hypothetical protein JKX99_00185 [Robiginitomaculum sp.]|nr:hypothetical protein [Robiginitomaculum sp.]